MPVINVVDRSGDVQSIKGISGQSVMEILRDAGHPEILALCGGCCSCATCHVFVDRPFYDRFPPPSEDESDLLDGSDCRGPQSRLSCQLIFEDAMDGLTITVAPED